MIIKNIAGTCGSGKSRELIKEITDGTLIISQEMTNGDIKRVADSVGVVITHDCRIASVPSISAIPSFVNRFRPRTLLLDYSGVTKKDIQEISKMGLEKIVYTTQLNASYN